MSSSVTVIGGVHSGTLTGIVTVPGVGISGLQTSLDGLSSQVEAGIAGLTNFDAVAGTTFSVTGSGLNNILEITNTDSTGATTSGSLSGTESVSSSFNNVIVQAPGTFTVNGSGASTNYLLSGQSNVTLNTNGGNNTIVAAGGTDTINMMGNNAVSVTGGSDRVRTFGGSNTVVATGSASVIAGTPAGYAGSIDFVNQSSSAAVVLGGSGTVTAFGGSAGGSFSGGTSGHNLLVGNAGAVTLVGGGNADTLEAGASTSSSTGPNYLFAGSGNETLSATSVTGNNLFGAGSGSDVISTAGSGSQYFFASSGSATMSGSTVHGANNVYFFGGTNSGGNDVITNFGKGTNELVALNGVQISNVNSIAASTFAPQGGALVSLSDGTQVQLLGVNATSLSGSVGGRVITT